MAKKTFYIIDGSSYIYRAYFAIRELSTSTGLPTNAVYGFTQMLLKIIKDKKPTLEQAQHLVDGYVELHTMRDGRQMLMNEDALRLDMELNLEASMLFGASVHGPVVILEGEAKWDND